MQKIKGALIASLGIGGFVCLILGLVLKVFPLVFIFLAAAMYIGVVIVGITILLSAKRNDPPSR
jgi:predicted lipid-binding transport protein (Tim44 family)